jgi:predicted kinase
MAKVIIMRGVSGSGKSTYARKHYPAAYKVSADDFFMKDGEYKFDPKDLSKAHASCLQRFTNLVTHDYGGNIVVDNTNTTAVEIAPYAALALAYGHELEIVTLDVPFNVAWGRNVHKVPLEVARPQFERLMRETNSFPRWWPHRYVRDSDDSLEYARELGFLKGDAKFRE